MAMQALKPRPPSTSSRANSYTVSVRSAASRASLEGTLAASRLASLIEIKAQLDAKARGARLGPKARSRLDRAAKQQAKGILAISAVPAAALPKKEPNIGDFRTGKLDPALLEAVSVAAEDCAAMMSAAPTPIPEEAAAAEPLEATPGPTLQPQSPKPREKRLPKVNVAGKLIPLGTLIQDKVYGRGKSGANQLRKMFKTFDLDKNGRITMAEMDRFLRKNNIKIKKKTLDEFYDQWAGKHSGEAAIDYLEFVQRILPPDFPKRDQIFVDDIASMAHEDTNKSAIKSEISSVPLFKSLSEEERQQLAQCTTRMSYAEDELIIEQGAVGNSMYILVSGEATAEKDGKAVYTYRNRGDFFGELALSSPGGLRAASVRAVGKAETSCFMIGKKNLDKVMGLSSEMLVERQRTYGTFTVRDYSKDHSVF